MNIPLNKNTPIPTGTTSQEPVIEVRKLRKSFGSLDVLKDISLTLYKGENLVVLGKSGSGKSVLIKCIVGLLRPDDGEIRIFGEDVDGLDNNKLNVLRRKIGFLFQRGALYDSMTVRENIEFPLRRMSRHLSEEDVANKIKEVLENVGLIETIDKMPSELSGGMRKRISLARTLVVDPLIMLYDEPTTGLDPITSHEISTLINVVKQKYKTSSIIITHDIECARATSDRLIMIKDGEIYAVGTIEDFNESTDPVIASFFKSNNAI